MNPRERLQYALYLQRLHDLFVIKENIAFEYQHKNYNKAAKQIDIAVDKMLHDNVVNAVDGTVSLKDPKLDHIIEEALTGQQNMLVKNPDHYIRNAVEQNTKQFSNFLQNRIEKENYSLQKKIQEEYDKRKNEKISDEQLKKEIKEKFLEHGRKRAKNIVKDALHTNQAHMSWVSSREGYKYKVWMNGQSKSGVRYWHVRSKIQPVEIDDFFDIYGPTGHASMMYPGDLNGGAENVANCRCWLYYTNIAPSNLKPRGTIQVNPNVNLTNENKETFSANSETKGKGKKTNGGESTSSNKKEGIFTKIRNKITNFRSKVTSPTNFPKNKNEQKNNQNIKIKKDLSKSVTVDGKTAYGISERKSEKDKFGKKYGIKDYELTDDEFKFVKLYSDEGFSALNNYMREVKGVWNPFKRRRIKKYWSKEWDKTMKLNENYMPMPKAMNVGKKLYKKAKILEEDLVVVRRQDSPLTEHANNGVYRNDAFLSTSLSKNLVEYGEYVNYIRIPKGEKILYIECVTATGMEYEVLLHPGAKFRMIDEINPKFVKWSM